MSNPDFKTNTLLIIDAQGAFVKPPTTGEINWAAAYGEVAFPSDDEQKKIARCLIEIDATVDAIRPHGNIIWSAVMMETHNPSATDNPMRFQQWVAQQGGETFDFHNLKPQLGDFILTKHKDSCFSNPRLLDLLVGMNTDQLYVCGFHGTICVKQTVKSALHYANDMQLFPRGLEVAVVGDLTADSFRDGIGFRRAARQEKVYQQIKGMGVRVITSEEMSEEICGKRRPKSEPAFTGRILTPA